MAQSDSYTLQQAYCCTFLAFLWFNFFVYTLRQKCHFYFLNNFVKPHLFLIIIGVCIPEYTCNKTPTELSIFPDW